MNIAAEDYALASKISNQDLLGFAQRNINLPPEKAQEYRDRTNSLATRLQKFIEEATEYDLVRTFPSGSLAKGTSLKKIGDLDLALYVKAAGAPKNDSELVAWMIERLKEVFPDFADDRFEPQDHCVKLIYATGPSIDVVPVLYEGEANNVGYLILKDSGRRVMTSIPLHLEFIRKRKSLNKVHFAQLVRLAKYWVAKRKELDDSFRFKSLMVELICAHLCDSGLDPSDYAKALESFFAYIVRTELKSPIVFADYYKLSEVKVDSKPVQIYDPVNPENNIAAKYTDEQRIKIIKAAQEALNALSEAAYSITKAEALNMWQVVLGPTFQG